MTGRERIEEAVNTLINDARKSYWQGDVQLSVPCYGAHAALMGLIDELIRDQERLDWLEKEAYIEPLALHDGRSGGFGIRGLGLMPGNVRRTLREAIDTARSQENPE